MRARLLHPSSTASRAARYGILRYGSGEWMEVQQSVDGAIPGTFFSAVRNSRLVVGPHHHIIVIV